MPRIYEICADEAWTHGGNPPNRYWCFFGGILGLESDLSHLEGCLRRIVDKHGHRNEIKWANVSDVQEPLYEELVNEFFVHLMQKDIKYRQLFLDRKYVYVPESGEKQSAGLDTQFKLYYQFLKHHFGVQYLPRAEGSFDTVFIRLDGHSSQEHTDSLKRLAENLPVLLGRTDLHFYVSFVNSKKHLRLQMCDLLMGAAGSHGNKMHLRREPGQHGMTAKQKCRVRMAKYIYEKIKELDNATRGSLAFNWFESTGLNGNRANQLHHKVRIWKFKPRSHRIDKGWENDHLDNQGRYIAPHLVDAVERVEGFDD